MIEPRHIIVNLPNTPPNVPGCKELVPEAVPQPVAVTAVVTTAPKVEPIAAPPADPTKTLLISEEGMRQALLAIGVDGPAIRKLIKLAEII